MRKAKILTPNIVLLLSLIFPLLTAHAFVKDIKGAVNIEADQLNYDKDSDAYHASGNVIVTFEGGFLVADTVVYHRKTGDVFADGDVYLLNKAEAKADTTPWPYVTPKAQDDILEGEKIRYNLTSQTGIVYQGKAFLAENHLYLKGDTIEKRGVDTYHLKNATATTCDGDWPAWRFTGREFDVTTEGYGVVRRGTFQVNNIPLLYTPYFIFPAKTKRQSGFLPPQFGYSSDQNGWDIELPFFWAISDHADATFYQRYLEKRGLKEGMEFRYTISKDSFGTFYGDYLNDTKDVSTLGVSDIEDGPGRVWQGNQRRWSYYLNHETTFSPGFYFRTDIARVSDHWYFRDFEAYNYYTTNYTTTGSDKFRRVSFYGDKSLAALTSTARVVKDWSLYNLTVQAQYTDNLASNESNDATLQSYPYVTFTGINRPIFNSPVNFSLSSSYQNAFREVGQKGQWADVNPIFSLPHSFGDYLQITPSVGLKETVWEGRGGTQDMNGSRDLYTLGLNASTEVHRIFNMDIGSVNKIRHSIKPEVTYSYIPYANQTNMPDFVTAVSQANSVTYSLTNTVIAKMREEKKKKPGEREGAKLPDKFSYLEFLSFKLSQTFDIQEYRSNKSEADRRPFSPMTVEFNLNPQKYLTYRSQATYDTNDGEWKTINHDLTVSDWRGDTATIGYRYTQDSVQELNLNLLAKVTRTVDLKYIQRRNMYDQKDLEKTYILDYHKQCWSMEFTFSDLQNDRRYIVFFTLYGIGPVGKVAGKPESLKPL